MKVQNSCVPTSGRRADNDLNLRHQHQPNSPPDKRPIPANRNPFPKDDADDIRLPTAKIRTLPPGPTLWIPLASCYNHVTVGV